ncbi:ABC transporter substrate-binding protein [Halomonas beimenensis]|uniref:Probable sugar-binding periplasmic protein n=1 Tax=Halomonas beimenensis TaxID=475662 RepID=A0A291P985_9GAMM|nr:ABC transporter substrate-binding protein [Halomonas beimenensis]ATJ83473.1 ABC-type sugar transport system, periplasmic component [Halomonas beimenensis]
MRALTRLTTLKTSAIAVAMAGALGTGQASAGEVEVLHWWTSGGEAEAVGTLRDLLEAEGHEWKDFAVAGGGGDSAMTVLKSRAMSGNPPAAAQIKGPEIQEWGELGLLGNLDPVAEAGDWDALLPEVVADIMRHEGHYVAVPVNVHRINWLWANPEVLADAGVEVPTTWDELFAAGEALREAGYVPLAHGGQPWQDATTFETVVLSLGGSDFYRRAFVELDQEALESDTMIEALTTFKRLRGLMDEGMPGRDWNLATSMVIEGEAAMQIMGDWAKGEFTAAGLEAGEDYLCAPVPGTADAFAFNIDSFAMFRLTEQAAREAQYSMARLVLEPEFQHAFNRVKGSIPARPDLDMDEFDACAQRSMADFRQAEDEGGLVPSMAHRMAMGSDVQGAFYDIVTNYFNSSDMSADQAAERLAQAASLAL